MTTPVSDSLDRLAAAGAERALTECLCLCPGDLLSLFYDEVTSDCAQIVAVTAQRMGIRVLDRFIPLAEQVQLAQAQAIDTEDHRAIEPARAVLVCLSADKTALPYRRRLVERAVDESRYVGIIPGATRSLLAYAINIDYEQVRARCDDLALAMLVGEQAVLTTSCVDSGGVARTHKLFLRLGGFQRSPITSTGIIQRGTWGNLPGGETFIAPLERSAEGCFVLNGAFTRNVLASNQAILLTFDAGWLQGIEEGGTARARLERLLDWPLTGERRLGLAELGVGVNTGVGRLTGDALFDEKLEGTAHIAVGDNSMYGGTLRSPLHEDFIAVRPSLTIDGKPILTDGRYTLDPTQWREDEAAAAMLAREIPDNCLILKTELHCGQDSQGRLNVCREVGARRSCTYTVGAPDLSRQLARLKPLLPPMPQPISLPVLWRQWQRAVPDANLNRLKGLVAVLARHEVVMWLRADA